MSKRSYVFTTEEWPNKVKDAFVTFCDPPHTDKHMAEIVGLHRDTIRNILRRTEGVNLATLKRLWYCPAWDLGLDLKENLHYEVFTPHDPMLQRTLHGRYTITKRLGSDEFSEMYLAEDRDLGNRQCVVKQLRRQSSETATRRFDREVSSLYQLGEHNQIPSLLAHFEEEGDFYLVHEMVEGHALSEELIEGQQWTEPQTIGLLQDILGILVFVHQHNVIHRNINPQNLIRRSSGGKIVLINFASVKQINTGQTRTFTSTHDYMSPELVNGTPLLCSDVYAVGILGIQALTGLQPRKFRVDRETKEFLWRDKAQVSPELADILSKMVRYYFRDRYPSAAEALKALQGLGTPN